MGAMPAPHSLNGKLHSLNKRNPTEKNLTI